TRRYSEASRRRSARTPAVIDDDPWRYRTGRGPIKVGLFLAYTFLALTAKKNNSPRRIYREKISSRTRDCSDEFFPTDRKTTSGNLRRDRSGERRDWRRWLRDRPRSA